MRRAFALLLSLIVVTGPASAGDTQASGSAKELHGRVDSWIIFVSTPEDSWTWKERREMLYLLKRAQRWLKYEHAQYTNTSLKFRNHRLTRSNDVHMDDLPAGTRSGLEDVELVNRLLPQVGFMSSQSFLEAHPTNQQQIIFFLKRSGASYAIPQESHLSSRYDLEGLVLYQDFAQDTPQCASCIAHEILHIFGAWDFYPTFQTSAAQFDKASTLFPNSVMLRTSYNEFELSIDPVTRWRIGWGPKPDDADFFTPSKQK